MSTTSDVTRFLAKAFNRLADAFSSEPLTLSFLRELGWSLSSAPPALAEVQTAASAMQSLWSTLDEGSISVASADQLATALEQLWTALTALEASADPPGLTGFATELGRTIFDYWIIEALDLDGWIALPLVQLLGVVEVRYVASAPPRAAYISRRIMWDRLGPLFSDPASGFRARFGWGTPDFDAAAVLAQIRELFIELRWPAMFRYPGLVELGAAGGAPNDDLCVDLELLSLDPDTTPITAGVRFLSITPASGLPGLALVPYVDGTLGATFPIASTVTITIDATFDLAGGIAVTCRPDTGFSLVTGIASSPVSSADGHATITLAVSDPTRPPKVLVDALGLQLVAKTVQGRAIFRLQPAPEIAIEAELPDGVVHWDASQAPGVLAALFGDRKIDVPFAITIGWSSTRGFYFGGGSGLSALIPLTLALGPITITGVRASAGMTGDTARAAIGVDGMVALGPVEIGWQQLGVGLTLVPGTHSSAASKLSMNPSLPTAMSIAVKSSFVNGSGTIQHADDDHYAGALSLSAFGVSIAGAASVANDNGAYSVGALATATWPGIPIGLGFELIGMTALLGLRRRIDDDAGRAMLRTGGIASLLTLSDPLRGLDALARMLPVANGRDVVGIGPTISWGEPRVFQADLAVLLELPEPVRIVLLAAAQLGLPTLSSRIVDIRLDAIGVLDLSRAKLAIDASLHDSKLAGYALTGDLALRLGWGDAPELLLAIGGFHPKFTPPAGFPALQRLQLAAGTNPQLRLQAYLAITSNTAQVGAQADLSYKGGGFTIAAQVGFDALFVFVPFQFDVDIHASASISWHGYNLVSVSLDFDLTGPHPWHAVGNASFSVLWWNPSVGFDVTWGDATPAPLPPPPDVAAILRQSLGDPSAWHAQLPADEPSWVVLASATTTKLHPLAAVVVRQRVVPLGIPITQYGNIPLAAPIQFAIAKVTVGSDFATTTPVADAFAPGQFTQLSNDQKLVAPSFEVLESGVSIGGAATTYGASARASLGEQTIEIDPLAPPPPPAPPPHSPVRASLATWMTALREHLGAPPRSGPRLGEIGYVLASTSTLAKQGDTTTYAVAAASLSPGLQVVPAAHAGS